MKDTKTLDYVRKVIENMPSDWLGLTTHRLDIYNEKQAKTQFIDQFNELFLENNVEKAALLGLPTAYDYIRLGHPLSCVLEWTLAQLNELDSESVISFDSKTIPLFSVLRKNLLEGKKTQVLYKDELPKDFDAELIKKVYGYDFELKIVSNNKDIPVFEGSTVYITQENEFCEIDFLDNIDFQITLHGNLGSVLYILGKENQDYIADIQHVRRRETVAMTPDNTLTALKSLSDPTILKSGKDNYTKDRESVVESIQEITGAATKPLMGSSGLSVQYAIMMGLIDDALANHPGKAIKFIVPPNCYGGTNDQARRVAACLDHVEIVDLPVDGNNDMVQSIHKVLDHIAGEDAIPYIIAEIPTNPRVEVPDLENLQTALKKERLTSTGEKAVDPVFILDQTFCPNYHFLGEGAILSTVRAISYASGSKFPSGGKCTAGYCVGNQMVNGLIDKIEHHLNLCDNQATRFQMQILAEQLPSMNKRIKDAYMNTRDFVSFIEDKLPTAKINFVSEELASQGFTPSVFSLDLPTKGETPEEREQHKRELNHRLINMMITQIPEESKYCVSYGQEHGVYWTIPATSTQGTTKEGDKDYIARVSLSPNMDLERHKHVFSEFVASLEVE